MNILPHKLLPQHEAKLRASGISPEIAAGRGYFSAETRAVLARLGFADYQQLVPALVVPIWSVEGLAFNQIRPDVPRSDTRGHKVKYETSAGAHMVLDVHPSVKKNLRDPSIRLWITEGPIKADALNSRGETCIGVLGVWNWRGRNEQNGKVALACWESVALNERLVLIAYDSDVIRKREVQSALVRLREFLKSKGAVVRVVYLPSGPNGEKVAIDDYLAAGHTVADALALALDEPPVQPAIPLGVTLGDVADYVTRFVVFRSKHQAVALALWTAHTHVYDRFDVSPFLNVTSPEKRSGKTRLQECVEFLVPRPWRLISPSEAVLYRRIDDEHPTLLIDEIDTIFGSKRSEENHEPLRALLNAGNRRGVRVPRCVGEGTKQYVVEFDVFTPRMLVGIGKLPDTVADRCITFVLQRRAKHELIERFRFQNARDDAQPIREELEKWALSEGASMIGAARPVIPAELNDRAAEMWEPLFVLADSAGGDWPRLARAAAVALSAEQEERTETLGVRTLWAVVEILEACGGKLPTAEIVKALVKRDDGDWPEMWEGKVAAGNINGPAQKLSKFLEPFGVIRKTIKLEDGTTAKGYDLEDFSDARLRYPPLPAPANTPNPVTGSRTVPDTAPNGYQGEQVTGSRGNPQDSSPAELPGNPVTDETREPRQPLQGKASHQVTGFGPFSGAERLDAPQFLALAEKLGWPKVGDLGGSQHEWVTFLSRSNMAERDAAERALRDMDGGGTAS